MKWNSKYQDEEGGTTNRGVHPVFDTSDSKQVGCSIPDRGSKHSHETVREGLKHSIVNISGPHRGNDLEIFREVLEHTIPEGEKLLIADRGYSRISSKHNSN